MRTSTLSVRRACARLVIGTAGVTAAVIGLPGLAQAHVTVQPGTAEGGSFSVVALRVPSERDDASTTRVRVVLPKDQPIGSVRTTPLPGWTVATTTRKLAEPIDMFGEQLDTVVSQVTWTATGKGIGPDQFQDFALSLGPLPESGQLVFKAVQTYSSGETVRWSEVSLDDSVEPEHPAPVLTLTAPAADGAAASGETTGAAAETASVKTRPVAAETTQSADLTVPTALSGAALAVALGALGLAWRRGRA